MLASVLLVAVMAGCSEDGRDATSAPSDEDATGETGVVAAGPVSGTGSGDLGTIGGREEPRTRWSRPVGAQIDWLRVGGDRAFFLTSGAEDQHLVAVDVADGQELWQATVPFVVSAVVPLGTGAEVASPIVTVDPLVVLVDQYGEGMVALDPATGETAWSRDGAGELSSTTAAGRGEDACLLVAGDSPAGIPSVTCVDTGSGEDRWQVEGAVAAADEHQAFIQGPQGLDVVDLATGATAWSVLSVEPETVVPAESVVVGCQGEVLSGFARDSGALRWRVDVRSDDLGSACHELFVGRRMAFVASAGGTVSTIDLATGAVSETDASAEHLPPGRQSETAVYDDRWILGQYGSVDARNGRSRSAPDGTLLTVALAAEGVVQVWNPVDDDGGGHFMVGLAAPTGDDLWAVSTGWGEPDVAVADGGLLVANLGAAGVLWSGGPDGQGPALGRFVAAATASQVVPEPPLVLGQADVFGVPLGVPLAEAERQLTEILGPPTRRDRWGLPDSSVTGGLSWGSLSLFFTSHTGDLRLDDWTIPQPSFGAPWPLPGGITPLSTLAEIEAAGYEPSGEELAMSWCAPDRPSVCTYFSGEGIEEPPGPSDTPTAVMREVPADP